MNFVLIGFCIGVFISFVMRNICWRWGHNFIVPSKYRKTAWAPVVLRRCLWCKKFGPAKGEP